MAEEEPERCLLEEVFLREVGARPNFPDYQAIATHLCLSSFCSWEGLGRLWG